MALREDVVAFTRIEPADYPKQAPFHPSEAYPEYPFKELAARPNQVYAGIRDLFRNLRLDQTRYGTPEWNPLGELIKPGDSVLLKPNFVRHYHVGGKDVRSVITHGSVIRAILDYVYLGLGSSGTITIGDAPVQQTDIESIWHFNGINGIVNFYGRTARPVHLLDFRREVTIRDLRTGIRFDRIMREGDVRYLSVDLGQDSCLVPIIKDYQKFRVSMYNPEVMLKHHSPERNEYLVPHSVLDADLVINIPKLKTHKKVGLTCCLKNLVGINGNKDWLPHYRIGSSKTGGDQYEKADLLKHCSTLLAEKRERVDAVAIQKLLRLCQKVLLKFSKILFSDTSADGSWHGNDTAWRMVLDLNLLLLRADKQGVMTDKRQRRVFSVVDGIIAGEAEGPMAPDPKHIGVLTAGIDALLMDTFHASLMGFDYELIPLLREGYERGELSKYSSTDIRVLPAPGMEMAMKEFLEHERFSFVPPSGWSGRIELEPGLRKTTAIPFEIAVDGES